MHLYCECWNIPWATKKEESKASLGEEMIKPDIRKRVDSGNVDRHTRRAMTVMVVPRKQPTSPTTAKEGSGRRYGRCCFVCPAARNRRTDWKCCQCSKWVRKDHTVKSIKNNESWLLETIIIHTISFTFLFQTLFSYPQKFHVFNFI
jgi:hypothetical protein